MPRPKDDGPKIKKTVSLYVYAKDMAKYERFRVQGALKMSHADLFHLIMDSFQKRGEVTK